MPAQPRPTRHPAARGQSDVHRVGRVPVERQLVQRTRRLVCGDASARSHLSGSRTQFDQMPRLRPEVVPELHRHEPIALQLPQFSAFDRSGDVSLTHPLRPQLTARADRGRGIREGNVSGHVLTVDPRTPLDVVRAPHPWTLRAIPPLGRTRATVDIMCSRRGDTIHAHRSCRLGEIVRSAQTDAAASGRWDQRAVPHPAREPSGGQRASQAVDVGSAA